MSLRIEPTTDRALIRAALVHPAVWAAAMDDSAGDPVAFDPPVNPDLIYLAVWDGEAFGGLFIFVPQSSVCYEVHARLLPVVYGSQAAHAARLALAWIWRHTGCWRVFAGIPVTNTLAIRFFLAAGAQVFGCNPLSWGKGGMLHDCLLLGVSRPGEV